MKFGYLSNKATKDIGILIVVDEWGLCPKCGKKSIKINKDTVLKKFPMYCKRCKKEYIVSWQYA